jgi:hypothetical protein
MNIELEAVGTGGKTGVKGEQRVLGRQRTPAAMREHERTIRRALSW